jgi:hypothetical protein
LKRLLNRGKRPANTLKAGRGNRTLVFSLEGYCSTIELHPQDRATPHVAIPGGRAGLATAADLVVIPLNRGNDVLEDQSPTAIPRRPPRARGHAWQWGVQDSNLRRKNPSDLQSDPFDRSGNSPPWLDPGGTNRASGVVACVPVTARVRAAIWMASGRGVDRCGCPPAAAGGLLIEVSGRSVGRTDTARETASPPRGRTAELAAGVEPATC